MTSRSALNAGPRPVAVNTKNKNPWWKVHVDIRDQETARIAARRASNVTFIIAGVNIVLAALV